MSPGILSWLHGFFHADFFASYVIILLHLLVHDFILDALFSDLVMRWLHFLIGSVHSFFARQSFCVVSSAQAEKN